MFDALPETKGKGGILGGRAVSTAVLGHGLAILFAISASVLAGVDPGEDPPLPWDHTVIIVLEPPPLGTNPDAGGKGPRAPEIQATRTPPPEQAEPVQPRAIPDPDPQLDEPTPVEAVPDVREEPQPGPIDEGGPWGEGTGDGRGKGDGSGKQGVPWGVKNGSGPMDGAGRDPEAPRLVTVDMEAPVLLLRVQPEYPELARRSRIEGVVILEAIIGLDGAVEGLHLLRSVPLLDGAAKKAVQQWRYRPARQSGRLVKVYVTIRVEFRLH